MKKLIVGNWKMNPQTMKEAEILFKGINKVSKESKSSDVVICPPFTFLLASKNTKSKKIILGAQDVSKEEQGAFTGDVSAKMLSSIGVKYVIIGHSERRIAGDTNEIVNKKINNSLKAKLMPILCVGESDRDHGGEYLTFIKNQLVECLKNVPKPQMKNITIAYEPIWAIGSGATREATSDEFVEVKIFIRKIISDIYDAKTAHNTRVLYGGSVHPENSGEFLHHGGADGLLVGRDSLNIRKFELIIKSA